MNNVIKFIQKIAIPLVVFIIGFQLGLIITKQPINEQPIIEEVGADKKQLSIFRELNNDQSYLLGLSAKINLLDRFLSSNVTSEKLKQEMPSDFRNQSNDELIKLHNLLLTEYTCRLNLLFNNVNFYNALYFPENDYIEYDDNDFLPSLRNPPYIFDETESLIIIPNDKYLTQLYKIIITE